MSLRETVSTLVVGAVVSLLLWLWFHPRPTIEQPGPETPVVDASPTPAPSIPPPMVAEAQEKLDQVFRKSLVIDTGAKPTMVTGDFNQDSSMDLAVAVKPRSEGLAELNGELPAWLTQDPFFKFSSDNRPPPIHVSAGEALVAILHGHEADGWRNPEAQQAVLLVNARGSAMRPAPLEQAMKAIGGPTENLAFGDVLAESLRGRPGFLLWRSARYFWLELPAGKTLPAD
jgi:hypothetical protein